MTTELENMLCAYLGELLFDMDNTIDWIQKEEIIRKVNAVNILLGQPVYIKSWHEKIKSLTK